MATLEKIRSNKKTLVLIIGLALAAFILTGAFEVVTQCSSNSTAAKFLDVKIDAMQLQNKMTEMQKSQQYAQMDGDQLRALAVDAIIDETLFEKEKDALGLTVTKKERTDFIYGPGAQTVNYMVMSQSGGAFASFEDLDNALRNPAEYGLNPEMVAQLKSFRTYILDNIDQMLIGSKFQNLMTGTLVANKLDAQAAHDNMTAYTVLSTSKAYATVDDAEYPVTDDEIKAKWQETQALYELPAPETRALSYIKVDVLPSSADLQTAQAAVEDAVVALRDNDGEKGLLGNQLFNNHKTVTAATVKDKSLKAFLDSTALGQAKLVNQRGYDYTIAKLLDRKAGVDTVTVDYVIVRDSIALGKSMLQALNAGTLSIDSIAPADNVLVQKGEKLSLMAPELAELQAILKDKPAGVFFTPDTAANLAGIRIFRISETPKLVPLYEYVIADYTVTPSQDTKNTLYTNLKTFVAENGTAAAFAEKAAEAGYSVVKGEVTPSSYAITGLAFGPAAQCPASYNAVVWAMDAKKGAVSNVFEFKDGKKSTNGEYLLAVAIDDIYKDGYYPATKPEVRADLESKVRGDKKGDALIADYKGKANDIAGYAALMEANVDTIRGINLNRVPDGTLAGRVASAQPNQLVGPFKTPYGVYVIEVIAVDNNGRPFDFDTDAVTFNNAEGGMKYLNNLSNVLRGRAKVDNKVLKVFRPTDDKN